MQSCSGCQKRTLVALRKRFDATSYCSLCVEDKYDCSSFAFDSIVAKCCSLVELQSSLKDKKFKPSDYERCLFYATKTGRKDLVATLLNRGTDPNTKILGRSALIEASENGEQKIVAELLKHGADVDAVDCERNSALMFACSNGHFDIVRMLLKHGVSVNFQNKQGSTAFMLGCMMGQSKILELLLSHQANYRLPNLKGKTPLMLASFYGRVHVVKLLLAQHDIDVNAKDIHKDTALIFAAQRGQQDICQALVNAGARANDTNQYNNSAKSYYAGAKMESTFSEKVAALFRTVCV